NSNYVITLDRIANKENGIEVIKKIVKHQNIQKQLNEWIELNIVNENFKPEEILQEDSLNEKHKFLPIDTKYFKNIKIDILSLFDNLDDALDGWLIKSENYQALNTILPKFREKVQTIYIDPPFNKEQDADYLYTVKYKDSTWATMLENRLSLAKDLLRDTGSIFVRCDYNGNWIVRPLMDEIFGKENFRNEIDIKRNQALPKTGDINLIEETENLYVFSKTDKFYFLNQLVEREEPIWVDLGTRPSEIENNPPRIVEGREFYPPKYRRWAYSQENIDKMYSKGRLKIERNKIKILLDKTKLGSNWTDMPGYSTVPIWGLKTENSEILLKRVIESTSNEGDLVMDFFLGSGTTIAVAHKLKRKWIGIEMGEHFYSVVLPRMKTVLAYDKSGISKEKDVKEKYNEKNTGGFFKYYELEQYEETLANTVYENHDIFIMQNKNMQNKNIYEQYIFLKDEKMLRALEIDYENNKVKVDLSKLYPNIDIAETLSNLTCKWIKKINDSEVEFEDGTKINTKELDYKLIKPLIWWE
ncbi:MAG: site-specific DNA-methyltransferase, partial [Candidatus Parvarchaeota archaeon]|nr:site-specific DNA-methyltransferase [Candidatus Rehaiarchaeum fermentans]